ncbi:Bacterial signaling protein N terminal repeat [Microdochium nivale]|nr:Bacterial signaling protein N terminal repeat [Microdochium nivale]
MATPEQLLAQYQGQIVPRAFNSGFVVISYVVSFIGAVCTLELINRRTSKNGIYNHLILLGSAVTMGGISIWCMHFIGNRAIELGDGEVELHIAYSPTFTVLSFFIPIVVLLVAFVAIGANNHVSWWRTPVGGILAGGAICGMHYVGNSSIANYHCVYQPGNVVGAAVISVLASTVALTLFFVSRASWKNSWWKRMLAGVVLAGAVSGMHWCASVGTNYKLIALADTNAQSSRTTTVIVVICLSVGAALVIACTAVYTRRAMQRYAVKAQHIVLAAAVFDLSGRIMVNPDGLLPSEKITDTYVERTASDSFSIGNPLFHWMFQASRNWHGLQSIIQGMSKHIQQLSKSDREHKVRLIDDNGHPIENYSIVFKELFCVAAMSLADRMKERLTDVGILWDEIMPTGATPKKRRVEAGDALDVEKPGDLGEKGESWEFSQNQHYARGSLMFLVRRVEHAYEVEKLEAAGFRFADVNQVCGIIGSSMQIQTRNLAGKLATMATYAEDSTMLEPGVHMGFFALKATVNSDFAFDILVRKGARSLLPSQQLPLEYLEAWQADFVRQLDRTNVLVLLQRLDTMQKLSPREMLFASQLYDAVESLRAWIDDPIFNDAHLLATTVQVPCRARTGTNTAMTCTMITLQLVVPIHATVHSPKCEFIPLNFFKTNQLAHKDSPHHAIFSRLVHSEVSPVVNQALMNAPDRVVIATRRRSGIRDKARSLGRILGARAAPSQPTAASGEAAAAPRRPSNASSSSTLKLWEHNTNEHKGVFQVPSLDKGEREHRRRSKNQQRSEFGGIMVSQEIKVDVRMAGSLPSPVQPIAVGPSSKHLVRHATTDSTAGRELRAGAAVFENDGDSKPCGGAQQGHELTAMNERSAVVAYEQESAPMRTFVDVLFPLCVGGRNAESS